MAVDRTFAGVNRDRPSGAKAARDSRSGMLRPVFRAAVREDLSAAGVALATAADADTQRTLLGLGTAAVEDSDAFAALGGTLVVENRTSDPGAPVSGQLWLRTDL